MNWALRRQIFYTSILVAFFVIFGFLIIYPRIDRVPSCTDGKKNGAESGVDCGGSCINACTIDIENVSVLWSRSFQVVPGRYNAVAYLANHNRNAVVDKINYSFRFADKDNIYIGKREGTTFIPPGTNFAVFEPAIDTGNSIPVYTSFEFTQVPRWIQASEEKLDQIRVLVSDIKLENETTKPNLSAVIKNGSLFTIPEVSVVAILYDSSRNAVSASSTFLDKLSPEEETTLNFTWPEPLTSTIILKEVIPMYNFSRVEWK